MSFQADYHIHHHLDACAEDRMTLPNIEEVTHKMGLSEIAILAHGSCELPGGGEDWGWWHKLKYDQFNKYLSEMDDYRPAHGTRILRGVESELMDQNGKIAVDDYVSSRIDFVALSLHYLPKLDIFPYLPDQFPRAMNDDEREELKSWTALANEIGTERILEALVDAHIQAIRKNPKVRTLAHLDDMSFTPACYGITYDGISDERLGAIMEPLMKTMAQHEVLWEITNECRIRTVFFQKAKAMGVKFTPTSDAHFIDTSWGPLSRWYQAVEVMKTMGLEASPIVLL